MKLDEILSVVKDVPHMTEEQGIIIYDLILDNDISNILELGTAHGTGSCYMGAALIGKQNGHLITIDNKSALDRNPSIYELIEKCNLTDVITPIIANTSYNWELMKLIEKQTTNGICEPIFDLCYIDGAHNFEVDCCAFFLVDKLLKPGGLLLFDDLNWTYDKSPSLKNSEFVKTMSSEERTVAHIKKLVHLVVLQHPNYHQASTFKDWFLIRKKAIYGKPNKIDLNLYATETSIFEDLIAILKKLKKKIFT